MNKKLKARMEMIKKLAKEKATDMPSLGEGLKGKKLSKVEVIAKDDKGLQEGLSKAQQILKAKLGDKVDESEDPDEDTEELEDAEECPACEGKGCPLCDDDEESY